MSKMYGERQFNEGFAIINKYVITPFPSNPFRKISFTKTRRASRSWRGN